MCIMYKNCTYNYLSLILGNWSVAKFRNEVLPAKKKHHNQPVEAVQSFFKENNLSLQFVFYVIAVII